MAQESILFPNDPPHEGDQFPIGNTTYAWDPTPGIWRAFTTATSSSGGSGGGALLPWSRIPCVGSVAYWELISFLWRIVGE